MEVIYRCNKCDDFESPDINIAVMHRCAPKLEVPPANGEQQGKHKICPRCGGRLSTDSGFDVCDDCGFDG